ncbi:MAG: sulfite exporter TauE/SafE family protein, partial [Bacteroidia bacterium]|nr:sulfite exporter TauE/SafE family protein [Bacteroidia bacterium]
MENLAYFILLALVAEILGTVGGFGSSLFFVPIAGLFLDFYSVLGITALFHVSSNISKIVFFRKGFDRKLVINVGIPAVLFVIVGAFLSKFCDKKILELSLAVFLIILSAVLLLF